MQTTFAQTAPVAISRNAFSNDIRTGMSRLVSANQGQIVGLELKHRHLERWALITPDASQPGYFRHQAFDRRGFFRHTPCETAEQALEGAVRDGFDIPDPGALARVSEELEWLEGLMSGLVDRRHQQAVETGSEVEA